MGSPSVRPAWLHTLQELSTTGTDTIVGVAICISNRDVPLVHAGVLYSEPGEAPRVLHLAFHAMVKDQALPDAVVDYHWAQLDVDKDLAISIAGYCRLVARRSPKIPYGIVYEGGSLAGDGTAKMSGHEVGLTCATFALAVLKWAGCELLDLSTWRARKEDDVWHGHIVKMLINFHCRNPNLLKPDHIVAVAQERGCARFRPEEVAAACGLPWPVSFAHAEPEGMAARAWLLAAS